MPAARHMPPKAITATEWLGGLDVEEDAHALGANPCLSALAGYWLDQKGSTYHLLPGGTHSLHVHTARPSGQRRYTAHLIRLAVRGGRARVVWGADRYTLCESSQDTITWRGRGENDYFDWVRIA